MHEAFDKKGSERRSEGQRGADAEVLECGEVMVVPSGLRRALAELREAVAPLRF